MHGYINTSINTYIHTYMLTYIHAYIHAYIHIRINKCMRTYIHRPTCMLKNFWKFPEEECLPVDGQIVQCFQYVLSFIKAIPILTSNLYFFTKHFTISVCNTFSTPKTIVIWFVWSIMRKKIIHAIEAYVTQGLLL